MNEFTQLIKYLPLAYSDYEPDRAGAIIGLIIGVIGLAFAVILVISLWKIFVKAGEPGWASIVPIYNLYVMYKISWGKGIYFLLLLIPVVNGVIGLITIYKLGQNFGKSMGYTFGMMFLPVIFMPMLAFSDAQYLGIADGRGGYMPVGGYAPYGQQMYQGGYPGQPQQPYQQGGYPNYQGQPYSQGGYPGQPQGGYQGQPQPYQQGGYPGQPQQPYQGDPQQRPPQNY